MSTSSSPALSYGPPQIAFSFSCPLSPRGSSFLYLLRGTVALHQRRCLDLIPKKWARRSHKCQGRVFQRQKLYTYNCMKRSISMFFCLERCPGMVGIVNACSFARVCFQESIVLTTRSKKESRQHGISTTSLLQPLLLLFFG